MGRSISKKKATMKDIAREANVSLATVSYVLNHNENQKISHVTRIRVFEAAQRLMYVPDLAARSLSKYRNRLVGILVNTRPDIPSTLCGHYYRLVNLLREVLGQHDYDVILLSADVLKQKPNTVIKLSLDAVFAIDISDENFHQISSEFIAPIIILDAIIEDPLFYKILPDYPSAFSKAFQSLGTDTSQEVCLIIDAFRNRLLIREISRYFPIDQIYRYENSVGMEEFIKKHSTKKFIVVGEILGNLAELMVRPDNLLVLTFGDIPDVLRKTTKTIPVSHRKRVEKAIDIMKQVIRIQSDFNDRKILISD